MKILFLLPILLYISLVVFNLDSLFIPSEINFFNFHKEQIPFLLYSSIFLISYIIFLFIIYDLKWILIEKKFEKYENEIISLKSRLYDEREDVFRDFISDYDKKFDNFTKEQKDLFEKFKFENELDLAKQRWETDRILEKLNLIDKWIFEKFKDTFKK